MKNGRVDRGMAERRVRSLDRRMVELIKKYSIESFSVTLTKMEG